MRHELTKDAIFYVSPTGSDQNDGFTPETSFLTPQAAYEYILENFDMRGHVATLKLLDGLYTSGIKTFTTPVGGPNKLATGIKILGNLEHPDKVVISTIEEPCFLVTFGVLALAGGFTLSSERASAIYCSEGARLNIFGKIAYGECGQYHIHSNVNGCVADASDAAIITGGAQAHYVAQTFSTIEFNPQIVVLRNRPCFPQGYTMATSGFIIGTGSVFKGVVGTDHSPRYTGYHHSVIDTGGAGSNFFPGNSDGVMHHPAIYI